VPDQIIIPDVTGKTALEAAFAYGAAGLYLVPVRPRTKHPGGYLGTSWPSRSVRTGPDVHDYWGERWPQAGIGIHTGRSGLTVIDVDKPGSLDERVRRAIVDLRPPFQVTRKLTGLTDREVVNRLGDAELRGHAIFRTPPGRVLGNSLGKLTRGWGEVRGLNGFIVTAPSLHEEDDGEYRWLRTGVVPYLPGYVADLLPEGAGDGEAAASDEQIEAFKAAHRQSGRKSPRLIDATVRRFAELVRQGDGRHQAACTIAAWICREAAAGVYAAGPALLDLKREFTATVRGDARPRASRMRPGGLDEEWRGIVAWAVGQTVGLTETRIDEIRARVDPSYEPPIRAAATAPDAQGAESTPADVREPETADEDIQDLFANWDPSGGELVPVESVPEAVGTEAWFWSSRKVLAHIRQSAVARYASPWATFGVVMARVLTATPPHVQLPNTIGGYGSLNLFTALVAPSGGGKGAAENVAAACVEVDHRSGSMAQFPTHAIGSGEGLAHMFMKRPKKKAGQPAEEAYQYNTAALVTMAEIDTLGALRDRQGSTLTGQLRQAAMGEQLGFFYVDPEKRMPVPKHAYRLCLVAGVQPRRAQVLLDEADGGTPQRFVWLPAVLDEGELPAEDEMPECPAPLLWLTPPWPVPEHLDGLPRTVIDLPDEAKRHTVELRRLHVQGLGDPLDGHANLTRIKVAAALAILDGRTSVSLEDWELSAVVMARSDATRKGVQEVLAQERREKNLAQAEVLASQAVVVEDRLERKARQQATSSIRNRLASASANDPDGEGWLSSSEVRRALKSTVRKEYEEALAGLVKGGQVEVREGEYHGQSGTFIRLAR
jgi:hypothetical protein